MPRRLVPCLALFMAICIFAVPLCADTLVPTPATFRFTSQGTYGTGTSSALLLAANGNNRTMTFNEYNGTSVTASNSGWMNLNQIFPLTAPTVTVTPTPGNNAYSNATTPIQAHLAGGGWSVALNDGTISLIGTAPTLTIRDPGGDSFRLNFTLHQMQIDTSTPYINGIDTGALPSSVSQPPTFGNYQLTSCTGCGSNPGVGTLGYQQLKAQLGAHLNLARLAFVFSSGTTEIKQNGANLGPYGYEMYLYVTPEPAFYGAVALGMAGLFGFTWWRRRKLAKASELPKG